MFLETKKEGEATTRWPLARFAAWLEKQPADKSYDFKDPFRCAWYQFSGHVAFCSELDELGVLKIVARYPRTFGAALERARMALSGA